MVYRPITKVRFTLKYLIRTFSDILGLLPPKSAKTFEESNIFSIVVIFTLIF